MIPGLDNFVAIDPGFAKSNGTGVAIVVHRAFIDLRIVRVGAGDLSVRAEQIRRQIPTHVPHGAGHIELARVIEHMRVYPGPQQKGDQNDLLDLSYLEGVIGAGASVVHLVPARKWKGNMPKDKMQERILARLRQHAPKFIDDLPKAKEARGSALEAAGLAFWTLGLLGQ